jgi:hypothetical protein
VKERLTFLNELVPADIALARQGKWRLKGAIETRNGILDFDGEVEVSNDNAGFGGVVLAAMVNRRHTAKGGADTVRFRGQATFRPKPPAPPAGGTE